MGVDHKLGLNWWVLHTPKKRDVIIVPLKKHSTRCLMFTHKFGPKTAEDVLALDKKNSNTVWTDEIAKEMKNV